MHCAGFMLTTLARSSRWREQLPPPKYNENRDFRPGPAALEKK
jgi:hypothetical protein